MELKYFSKILFYWYVQLIPSDLPSVSKIGLKYNQIRRARFIIYCEYILNRFWLKVFNSVTTSLYANSIPQTDIVTEQATRR